MRPLLGILLSILLLQSQVFALSGGPDYNRDNGGSSASLTDIVGTYGGVMTEVSSTGDAGISGVGSGIGAGGGSGAIAVYSLNIPISGSSTGSVLIFTNGNVYPGTITGLGDVTGGSATFKGIIEAKFNYNYELAQTETTTNATTGATTTKITYVTKTATVVSNGTVNTTIEAVRSGITTNVLMSGTATLLVGAFLNPTQTVVYNVSGYRQIAG